MEAYSELLERSEGAAAALAGEARGRRRAKPKEREKDAHPPVLRSRHHQPCLFIPLDGLGERLPLLQVDAVRGCGDRGGVCSRACMYVVEHASCGRPASCRVCICVAMDYLRAYDDGSPPQSPLLLQRNEAIDLSLLKGHALRINVDHYNKLRVRPTRIHRPPAPPSARITCLPPPSSHQVLACHLPLVLPYLPRRPCTSVSTWWGRLGATPPEAPSRVKRRSPCTSGWAACSSGTR